MTREGGFASINLRKLDTRRHLESRKALGEGNVVQKIHIERAGFTSFIHRIHSIAFEYKM